MKTEKTTRIKMLELIEKNPFLSQTELAKKLKISKQRSWELVHDLHDRGDIQYLKHFVVTKPLKSQG